MNCAAGPVDFQHFAPLAARYAALSLQPELMQSAGGPFGLGPTLDWCWRNADLAPKT
jgi:hypothetical protein